MPKVQIHIDKFTVSGDQIEAFTIVDKKWTDFNINRQEFETFCDENEMRYWDTLIYSGLSDEMEESKGIEEWSDIYAGFSTMERYLKIYIQHLYDAEEMNVEAVLNNIFSTHKAAV